MAPRAHTVPFLHLSFPAAALLQPPSELITTTLLSVVTACCDSISLPVHHGAAARDCWFFSGLPSQALDSCLPLLPPHRRTVMPAGVYGAPPPTCHPTLLRRHAFSRHLLTFHANHTSLALPSGWAFVLHHARWPTPAVAGYDAVDRCLTTFFCGLRFVERRWHAAAQHRVTHTYHQRTACCRHHYLSLRPAPLHISHCAYGCAPACSCGRPYHHRGNSARRKLYAALPSAFGRTHAVSSVRFLFSWTTLTPDDIAATRGSAALRSVWLLCCSISSSQYSGSVLDMLLLERRHSKRTCPYALPRQCNAPWAAHAHSILLRPTTHP